MPHNIDRDNLHLVLNELEQAKYNSLMWLNQIIRTIVCDLPADNHDLTENAYKECPFGQWYYGYSSPSLHNHSSFNTIGEAHEQMHKQAMKLLFAAAAHQPIETRDYDQLSNSVERLLLEINGLTRELEVSLYSRDPLTGAINRLDMLPVLREILTMGKRQSTTSSLVMIDFDNFKIVNDTYGHQAGDKVLHEACKFFMKHIRPYDKIFRFGGEEFLVCMLQADEKVCYERTELMRQGLAKLPIDIGNNQTLSITCSFGVTLLKHDLSIEENIEHADSAMYEAKRSGRNCTKIYAKTS